MKKRIFFQRMWIILTAAVIISGIALIVFAETCIGAMTFYTIFSAICLIVASIYCVLTISGGVYEILIVPLRENRELQEQARIPAIDDMERHWEESNYHITRQIKNIVYYYNYSPEVKKIEKDEDLNRLLIRKNFLESSNVRYDSVYSGFLAVVFSIIASAIYGILIPSTSIALKGRNLISNASTFFILISAIVLAISLGILNSKERLSQQQHNIKEFELSILAKEISKVENIIASEITNRKASDLNVQNIQFQQAVISALIDKQNKKEKFLHSDHSIIDDIENVDSMNLAITDPENYISVCVEVSYGGKKKEKQAKRGYIYYLKCNPDSTDTMCFASEDYKELYDILKKNDLWHIAEGS